jgi:PEP-CTERM motif-containing protein
MTTAGGQAYGARQSGGVYEQFADNGSFTPIPNLQADGLFSSQGMWGDAINGDIIAASNRGLVEIDPVAGTFRVINGSLIGNIDGVTLSPDGSTVYVANIGLGIVQSYNLATGALIQSYSATSGRGPDGTGVISGGSLNGDVIVNNNDGTVGLLDPVTGINTIIANAGTRGDWVSEDTSNGTLFVSQLESVDRLSCGPGCSIGGPPPTVPEPSTIVLVGSGGLLALFASLRRKLRKQQR